MLIKEMENNLALKTSLAEEKGKVEKLTIELSLANDSKEKLSKEHSLCNDSLTSLKNEHSISQESLSSLQERFNLLEQSYEKLWTSTSTSSSAIVDSNASTSDGCKRCYKIDINACVTNLDELDKKNKEIHRLKMLVKNGCKCQVEKKGTVNFKPMRHPSIKDGVGYNKYGGKSNGRDMVNGIPCVRFNKGVSLDVLLNKTCPTPQEKISIARDQPSKPRQVDTPNQHVPLSRTYASDYMCC